MHSDHPGERPPPRLIRGMALSVGVLLVGVGVLTYLAISWFAADHSGHRSAPQSGAVQVVKVVDGDTIEVAVGGQTEHVRLIGIDTPETKDPRTPVECFGPEASARTAELLPPGTEVRLVGDAEERDRYDRLLAYVYRASDDLFVNLSLARDGFAGALTIRPNDSHADEIGAAVSEARREQRGLWPACGGTDTPAS